MDLFEILDNLSSVEGVSGNENNAGMTALSLLKKYCPDAYIDNGQCYRQYIL